MSLRELGLDWDVWGQALASVTCAGDDTRSPVVMDRRRDVRHLPNSESARLQLDLDAASVTTWLTADVRNTPFGSPWVAYAEQQGWHPRWASAVVRRYAERLAERTCQEPAVARQQMLEQ